jgi:hypothetical protein
MAQHQRFTLAYDAGIAIDRVALVSMNMERAGFTPTEIDQTYATAVERVRDLRGVERAALVASSVPMRSAAPSASDFPTVPGRTSPAADRTIVSRGTTSSPPSARRCTPAAPFRMRSNGRRRA